MTVHESAGGWQENDGLSRLGDRYLISRTELLLAEVGTRLGLFDELATHGPETCPELAERTGLDEGYIREWLAAMAERAYLDYDASTHRFALGWCRLAGS